MRQDLHNAANINGKAVVTLEAKAVAELEAAQGATVAMADLRAKLLELIRRRTLGWDMAKKKFIRDEMETALRVEAMRGVKPRRSTGTAEDWFDQQGRSYDAVGSTLSSEFFDQAWEGLQNQIRLHINKADYVPVDVAKLSLAGRST